MEVNQTLRHVEATQVCKCTSKN